MQSISNLGSREADLAIAVIRTELVRRGRPAVVAVADAQGELIALVRLDGAPLASIRIAANKAWTAARERRPTRGIGQDARHPETGFDMAYYGDSRYVGWGGGIPVELDGAVVGAVAVSGLPEVDDMELAALGVAAIVEASSDPG